MNNEEQTEELGVLAKSTYAFITETIKSKIDTGAKDATIPYRVQSLLDKVFEWHRSSIISEYDYMQISAYISTLLSQYGTDEDEV